jgi:hypothetical protein
MAAPVKLGEGWQIVTVPILSLYLCAGFGRPLVSYQGRGNNWGNRKLHTWSQSTASNEQVPLSTNCLFTQKRNITTSFASTE